MAGQAASLDEIPRSGNAAFHADLRFHHRRRRLGRLRRRRAPVGERPLLRAGAGSRRHGPALLRPDAAGLRQDLLRPRRQLELQDRARSRAWPATPTTGRAASCSADRVRSTPWCGSGAIPPTTMPGATQGNPGWGFDRPAARLQGDRGQCGRRRSMARCRRAAACDRLRGPGPPADEALSRGGAAGRPAAQSGLQRRQPGRRRRLPDHRPRTAGACRRRAPSCGRR